MSDVRVVLTYAAGTLPGLAALARTVGLLVEERPLISFLPPHDWAPLDAAIQGIDRFRAIVFTSPRAAENFEARVRRLEALSRVRSADIWVTGAATAAAMNEKYGALHVLDPDAAAEGAAAALAQAMLNAGVESPVLYPSGDFRRDELPRRLGEGGVELCVVPSYRSIVASAGEAEQALVDADIVVVASPSVARLVSRVGRRPAATIVAIGATTASAARDAGWEPSAVAAELTPDAILRAIRSVAAGIERRVWKTRASHRWIC